MITAPAAFSKLYSVVADHDQLPRLWITQDQVDAAFGPKATSCSLLSLLDLEPNQLREDFFGQRVIYVQSNNVLLLRFQYGGYEVDLDQIHTERDLLAWVLQLVGKPWMNAERIEVFASAVADLKGFNIRL